MQPLTQPGYSTDHSLSRRWTAVVFAVAVIINLVLAGLAVGWRAHGYRLAPALTPSAWVGEAAPSMPELRGRAVLVAFFRCRDEDAAWLLNRLAAWDSHYGRVGLQVIAVHLPEVDLDRDRRSIAALVGRHPSFPIAMDGDLTCARRYGVQTSPVLVIVDRQGRIRHLFEEVTRSGDVEQALWALLAEGAP